MELLTHKKELHILVLGRTGSGKSTLINTMLGDHLAQQSYSPLPTQHDTVEIHTHRIAGDFEIFIYDTPGFFDSRISPEELLIRLKSFYPEGFDLIILCHRIIDRFDETNAIVLNSFCKHYLCNESQKPNVIVALTFANFFLDYNEVSDLKYSIAKEEVLKRKIAEFKTLFNKTAAKNGIHLFQNIPFVAMGSPRQRQLPTSKDWLDDLWLACYNKMEKDVKPLVNTLCLQKSFDIKGMRTTATGLCGVSSLLTSTSTLVPVLGVTVDKVMETDCQYCRLQPKRRHNKSFRECSHNVTLVGKQRDEIDSGHSEQVQQMKKTTDFNKSSQRLPTVKPEELSSDIFEALGLK